jgi:PPP family 3-phenylpropionic acid transporter
LFGGVGFGIGAFWASQTDLNVLAEFVPSFFFASLVVYFAGALAAFSLPSLKRLPTRQNILKSVAKLCASLPVFFLLIMIIAQWASHGLYTGFLAVAASKNGVSLGFVGYAVVVAILAETLFLFASARLLALKKWVLPILFLVLCVTIFRWLFSATVTDPWRFVATQGLHGITFGLFHAWAVLQFARIFPAHLRQTAQGWLLGAGYGLGGALGMGVSGRLLEGFPVAFAWEAMAGFAGVALVAGLLFSLVQGSKAKEDARV